MRSWATVTTAFDPRHLGIVAIVFRGAGRGRVPPQDRHRYHRGHRRADAGRDRDSALGESLGMEHQPSALTLSEDDRRVPVAKCGSGVAHVDERTAACGRALPHLERGTCLAGGQDLPPSQRGRGDRRETLAHLAPPLWEHINPYGSLHFMSLSPNCSERRDDVAVGLERTKMVSKAREQSWRG